MKKTYSLDSAEDILLFNEQLKGFGIAIDMQKHEASIDPSLFYRMKNRNAGRPYSILKENGYLAHITKGEVKERMKNENAEEIAASLGISRRTLFRRLKEAQNEEDELL